MIEIRLTAHLRQQNSCKTNSGQAIKETIKMGVVTYHFQTFTISSSEPVTIVSVPSASLLPHAAVQIASSWAVKTQIHGE